MGITDAVEDLGDDIGDYMRKRRGQLMVGLQVPVPLCPSCAV